MSVVAASLLWPAASGAAAGWQWPVEGSVTGHFSYRESTPFSRGQHRGIDIAAAEGTRVRSACRGRVRFAGSVAGSEGIVSVVCGRLTASYLHLGSISVRAGRLVAANQQLGRVGRRSRLYLGARRTGDRFGYVDPLTLLAGARRRPPPLMPRFTARRAPPVSVPLGPAPRSAPIRGRVPAPARLPGAHRLPATQPLPAAQTIPARPPLVVWAGVGLLALALPSWGVRRIRRRRRRELMRAVEPGLRTG